MYHEASDGPGPRAPGGQDRLTFGPLEPFGTLGPYSIFVSWTPLGPLGPLALKYLGQTLSFWAKQDAFGAKQEAFGAKQEASGANQNGSGASQYGSGVSRGQ